MHAPRPHISPALVRLRGWVVLLALTLMACAGGQLLIFTVVHYSDLRHIDEPAPVVPDIIIVDRREAPAATAAPVQAAPPPRRLARLDSHLATLSALFVSAGVVAAIALAAMCALGALVAAGGGVPGVERTVTAAFWSVILAAGALPWRALVGAGMFPGLFSSYPVLTGASDAVRLTSEGGVALAATFVLLPMLTIFTAAIVAWWFRCGVEAGVLATTVSELEERLDAEMATIRERGATSLAGTTRAVGALTRAISEPPVAPRPLPPDPLADEAVARSILRASRATYGDDRPIGRPSPGDALKRPI